MNPRIDEVGNRYGKWTVIGPATTKHDCSYWLCVCDCGVKRDVRGTRLRNGSSIQCVPCAGTRHRHGHTANKSPTPEYRTWQGIIKRCHFSYAKDFRYYGGRGISVCDRWRYSFVNFLEDMGPKPSPTHSIGRIDNSLGYEPTNCRWETPYQQSRNMSTNVLVEINGIALIQKDWCKHYGISQRGVRHRLSKGWDIVKAITTPSQNRKTRRDKRQQSAEKTA